MPNTYFQFKQFRINQEKSAMKVTTEGCLLGAWVAAQIRRMAVEPKRILDIGTGTGLLSLMLAQVTTTTQIDAIEINEGAYLEAANNFSSSAWRERLQCTHTSLQGFDSNRRYDLIICNPPFFGGHQIGGSEHKNQAVHNNHLSMEELSVGIDRLLVNDGTAFVLYPEWEMKAFLKWTIRHGLFPSDQMEVRNRTETTVFRMMYGFSRTESETQKSELIIRNPDGSYTEKFIELLKGYYLE